MKKFRTVAQSMLDHSLKPTYAIRSASGFAPRRGAHPMTWLVQWCPREQESEHSRSAASLAKQAETALSRARQCSARSTEIASLRRLIAALHALRLVLLSPAYGCTERKSLALSAALAAGACGRRWPQLQLDVTSFTASILHEPVPRPKTIAKVLAGVILVTVASLLSLPHGTYLALLLVAAL
jgi:hypothetical protein